MFKERKPKGYWKNVENVKEEAKKYKTRTDFLNGNKHVYQIAIKLCIMDDLFSKDDKYVQFWTEENIIEYASKFKTPKDLRSDSKYVWEKVKEKGLVKKLFPNYKKYRQFTCNNEIIKLCEEYKTISQLQKKDHSLYNVVLRRGLKEKAFRHMKNDGSNKDKHVYIIKNSNYIYVGVTTNPNNRLSQHKRNLKMVEHFSENMDFYWLSDKMKSELALKMEAELIIKFKNDGLNILNRNDGGASGTKTVKWTRKEIINQSKNYRNMKEMRELNNRLRCAIVRNGMYKEIKELLESLDKGS